MEQVEFHLDLAHSHEPLSLEVMRHVAVNIARKSKDGGLALPSLTFQSNMSWRRVMQLLDKMSDIKKSDFERNLLAKALILADKQRWNEVIALLEPHRQSVEENYRLAILNLLYRAASSLGDQEQIKRYRTLIEEQIQRDEEE